MNEGFSFVDICGEVCKGWLILYFRDQIVIVVNDVALADQIRLFTPCRRYDLTGEGERRNRALILRREERNERGY